MISVTNQRAGLILSQAAKYIMESKDYSHYNHTDACRYYRWTARESYQFMYSRPWQKVVDFYSNVVNGHTYLPELFGAKVISSRTRHIPDDAENLEFCEKSEIMRIPSKEKSGRWERVTFKIVLSYHGGSFDGWQKQPGLNTVQGLLEASLGKFVDEKKAALLRDKGLPVEACIVVAGRTDKGVTASQQVCSFYTWRKDVKVQDIEDAINCTVPGKLRVISVAEVSRMFHPNFSAKWRRYLYIFPFNDDGERGESSQIEGDVNIFYNESEGGKRHNFDASCDKEHLDCLVDNDIDEVESRRKSASFRVSKVDTLLRQLEGRSLSYKIFARDTKPSRNIGPPTECFIFHARAVETTLPCDAKDGEHTKAMCVELVGNRFLRKMVRVLVATSIREAAAGAEDDALIKLMDATCRRATSPPAPPDGLCLVDVGYEEFDPRSCLIN